MADKILLLHHFEPYWKDGLDNFNTSFHEEMEKVLDYILFSKEKPDKVIVTKFCDNIPDIDHAPLQETCRKLDIDLDFHEYGYGFRFETDEDHKAFPEEDFGKTWCHAGRDYCDESDFLIIEDWHRDLLKHDIELGGAFEGECLNDMETILIEIGASYNKIDELCVGTGVNYIPKIDGFISKEISDYKAKINSIENRFEDCLDRRCCDFDELEDKNPHIALKYLKEVRLATQGFISECEEKTEIDFEDVNFIQKANIDVRNIVFSHVIDDIENHMNTSSIEDEIKSRINKNNDNNYSLSLSLSH